MTTDEFIPYDPGNLDLLYNYMLDYQSRNLGQAPSYRDIMRDLKYNSTSVVANNLSRLAELGKVERVAKTYVAIPGVETETGPRIKYGTIAARETDKPLPDISFYRLVAEALELAMKPLAFDASVYYASPDNAPPVMETRYKKYASYARAYKRATDELTKLTGGRP